MPPETGKPSIVRPPHYGEQTRERMQDRIDELERQHAEDQEVIAHLEAEEMLDRDKIANLELALQAARRIGAAMGILMATHRVSDAQAFDLLRTASQHHHRKIRDIAEDVVYTGTLALTSDAAASSASSPGYDPR